MAEKRTEKVDGDKEEDDTFPRQRILEYFEDWFQSTPSIYPPNLHDLVELKNGRIIRRGHNKVVGISTKDYNIYNAVDAKYTKIVFEFIPMGKRQAKLEVDGSYILKEKAIHDAPWSFGSCHACWKRKQRNFTDKSRTPHPYQASLTEPNLSVLGGCGHVICNACVMKVEKYTHEDEPSGSCPYCGNQDAFPRDLRMWCISKEVDLHYENTMKMKTMKQVMDELGKTPETMHFSANGEITFTMGSKTKDKNSDATI
jgi:rubrerythrin